MKVVFTGRLRRAVEQLEAYVAAQASPAVAQAHLERLVTALETLADLPERHPLIPSLGPRTRGFIFERRLVVDYRVGEDLVELVALFGHGQELRPVEDPR